MVEETNKGLAIVSPSMVELPWMRDEEKLYDAVSPLAAGRLDVAALVNSPMLKIQEDIP